MENQPRPHISENESRFWTPTVTLAGMARRRFVSTALQVSERAGPCRYWPMPERQGTARTRTNADDLAVQAPPLDARRGVPRL